MDAVKKWGKILLPILAPIVTSFLGAGPAGMIMAGVGALALVLGGGWVYNKIKQWQFDNAHQDQQQDAIEDHNDSIADNEGESDLGDQAQDELEDDLADLEENQGVRRGQ